MGKKVAVNVDCPACGAPFIGVFDLTYGGWQEESSLIRVDYDGGHAVADCSRESEFESSWMQALEREVKSRIE